ncbi:MAG: DUF4358 domain-containing protein [Gemmiger sp.]
MKKLYTILFTAALCAAMLAGCGSSSASSGSAASSEAVSSEPASSSETATEPETADTAKLEAAVSAIEAVNPVANARAIDDFSVENEMYLTLDNLVAYKGDVTNDQADCALVFVAQAKNGAVDAVVSELEAYKATLAGNDLYAEFADKVAQAQDARIVANGNYVAMVIAGVNGPDYSAIDDVIGTALAG